MEETHMRNSSENLSGMEPQKFVPKTSWLELISFLQHPGLSFWVGIRWYSGGLRGVREASVSMWVPCGIELGDL